MMLDFQQRIDAFDARRLRVWMLLLTSSLFPATQAQDPRGREVVVVYNRTMPESKALAEFYGQRRGVPAEQWLGLDLPQSEIISRGDFSEKLEKPLLQFLEERGHWTFPAGTTRRSDPAQSLPKAAGVRYAVLCFGVPVRIWKDTGMREERANQLREELRRNEAAVDSELAVLPRYYQNYMRAGPLSNPLLGTTNSALLSPTNGLFLVGRIDGPSAEVARALVERAMVAERDGLWGRAYFDLRGVTNGNYKIGDDWIRKSAEIVRRLGYETYVDEKPETFPPGLPVSHIAFYAGWYDPAVSGPFGREKVDFMPGAFAYHLHSYNGATIRSTYERWVGPLLTRGATATIGSVDEPYLEGTPDLSIFFGRFVFFGFSFAEAAYASVEALSWQSTVVGDPLYRPFAERPQDRHERLEKARHPMLEWSQLKVVNLNEATGVSPNELLQYVAKIPELKQSAVLLEKQGDMAYARARFDECMAAYEAALTLELREGQRVRLKLALARVYALSQKKQEAYDLYRSVLKDHPTWGEPLSIYHRMKPLAVALGKREEAELIDREIEKLLSRP
ncbi:MAG: TIGR03790 family protein [Verrucomicrobia bacterium]|nr:TIGR03790 family protein [Verrucomicrobiota bacterium]